VQINQKPLPKDAKSMRLGQNFWAKKLFNSVYLSYLGAYLRVDRAKSHEAAKRIGGEMIGFVMSLSVFDIVFWLSTGTFLFIYTAKQGLLKRRFNLLKIS